MKILFETEGDFIFAIAKNEMWKKKVHDELLFAEITRKENVWYVMWEGEYPKKEQYSSLELAMAQILRDYINHTPYSNGISYENNNEE